MSSKRNQHVVPHGDKWAVRGENAKRATAITPTQHEAVDIARDIARHQGTELFIHRENGQIRDRDSHGRDPRSRKG